MRSSCAALALFSILMTGVLASTALNRTEAADGATVQITPPSYYLHRGDTVDVYVEVQNVSHLGEYDFQIVYDTSVLELVAVANDAFLGSTGRVLSCHDDSVPGTVDYHCNSSEISPEGPSGGGRLAGIRFKGIGAGDSPLHFGKLGTAVELGDSIQIVDYGEAVIRVGDQASHGSSGGDNSGGGSGGGGSNGEDPDLASTPTKVPAALTPTIPAGAVRTPTPVDEGIGTTYDPSEAFQRPGGRPGATSGGGTGSTLGASAGSSRGSGANGEFPIAGSGPEPADERVSPRQLGAMTLAGGLFILLGVCARKKRPGGLR